MTWVLAGVAAWVALSVPVAGVIGRAIHLADRPTPVERPHLRLVA